MDDETSFTIDRTTIDSLSSESRVLMLSAIRNRKKTNAELAKELSLKPSTIHHHLERLKEAGLVESTEDGHKWIYYDLTPFGRALLNPDKKMNVSIILSSVLTFVVALTAIYTYFAMPSLNSAPWIPVVDDPFLQMFIIAAITVIGQILILVYVIRRNKTG
jgi:ArsR family transcriptional regulator, arsenate/arsenite/antimonite-responsive transcriptional repressor